MLTLAQFEAALRSGQAAYNRGDFAAAFAALAPDCEYRPWDAFLTGPTEGERLERVLVGPGEVCRYFEAIFDAFPDFRNETVGVREAAPGVFVVLNRAHGTGGASGVPVEAAHGAVWEFGDDGMVMHVREFPTWREALEAVGLDPSRGV